ncbi:MAG: hypothetical protein BMS9Abin10_0500 [Gammaproteobacteria bacterium]|nr:MAG: hypothetical protein BMS9Abin10_0500 [Gammaproteobacteria bacterium]
MKNAFLRQLKYIVPAAALIISPGVSLAGDVGGYKVTHGIGIYLGVVPTDLITKHPREHAERTMHEGVPTGKHHHHVMVALFDDKTQDRITDATVTAEVAEPGLAARSKALEPMSIAGALTYGNYFEMRVGALYRISVQVRRPGLAHAVKAEFEYRHHE